MTTNDDIGPKDHAEAVALFRLTVIGRLTHRPLPRGKLAEELRQLSTLTYRPPDADLTHRYGISTLERWYYRYQAGGLEALRPAARSDRGHALELTEPQRTLLLDIRRDHPAATASVILREAVAAGRITVGTVSEATVRRLFKEHGLDRIPLRDGAGARTRLRWEAERPGVLWHGDVCHGPPLAFDATPVPVRVHGLLDDASRYFVALEGHRSEREEDMLGVLVRALRRHPPPDALYLDNGSTYRGTMLQLCCARLGITVIHAKPYDPEARGKMERVWRTLRQNCLDHLGALASFADLNVRLAAFLSEHYHVAAHASLMGRSPGEVWASAARPVDRLDEATLRTALTARVSRRVRKDTTLSIGGQDWELDQGFLAGQRVTVARCLVDRAEAPWIEHEGRRYALRLVDAKANASRRRPPRRDHTATPPRAKVPFDPSGTLATRAAARAAAANPHDRDDGDDGDGALVDAEVIV